MDAYRLRNAAEAEELDVALMLENGPLVVEWPERVREALPHESLWVDLRWLADEHRAMVFTARGSRNQELLAELRRRIFGGL